MSDDRIRRAERACAAAWPARDTDMVGDWCVYRSGDVTRRGNSASPAKAAPHLDARTLAAIDRVYAAAGQATILRVPDFARQADAVLDAAGFDAPEGRTCTLLAATIGADVTGAVILGETPDDRWIAARTRLAPRVQAAALRATLARIAAPVAFVRHAVDGVDGVDAAVAYGVLVEGLLVIEAVATDPARRRRGLARACVATLMAWARGRGVVEACLQVEADNAAAITLYEALGFTTHLYDYHYRRRSRR